MPTSASRRLLDTIILLVFLLGWQTVVRATEGDHVRRRFDVGDPQRHRVGLSFTRHVVVPEVVDHRGIDSARQIVDGWLAVPHAELLQREPKSTSKRGAVQAIHSVLRGIRRDQRCCVDLKNPSRIDRPVSDTTAPKWFHLGEFYERVIRRLATDLEETHTRWQEGGAPKFENEHWSGALMLDAFAVALAAKHRPYLIFNKPRSKDIDAHVEASRARVAAILEPWVAYYREGILDEQTQVEGHGEMELGIRRLIEEYQLSTATERQERRQGLELILKRLDESVQIIAGRIGRHQMVRQAVTWLRRCEQHDILAGTGLQGPDGPAFLMNHRKRADALLEQLNERDIIVGGRVATTVLAELDAADRSDKAFNDEMVRLVRAALAD